MIEPRKSNVVEADGVQRPEGSSELGGEVARPGRPTGVRERGVPAKGLLRNLGDLACFPQKEPEGQVRRTRKDPAVECGGCAIPRERKKHSKRVLAGKGKTRDGKEGHGRSRSAP